MTLLPGFDDDFVKASSKAEVTARLYALAGARAEPLGPGSKERKSVLLALGSAVGVELDAKRTKTQLARDAADALGVSWSDDYASTGQTLTLDGLNALLRGAADRLRGREMARPARPDWLVAAPDFVPARSKLEAVNRISSLTGSGEEDLGPGSKERKRVLVNLSSAWFPSIDTRLTKPRLGAALADALGTTWPAACHSTGDTITLDGLNTILGAAELRASTVTDPWEQTRREADALIGVLHTVLRLDRPARWDGRACIEEMRDAEYSQWRQLEWQGFYFEFIGIPALIDAFGGGPARHGATVFDYSRTIPWDLKAHSIGSGSTTLLNDLASIRGRLAEGPLGFIVLSGDADLDAPPGPFTDWHREVTARPGRTRRIGGLTGNSRARKRGFTPVDLQSFALRDAAVLDAEVLAGRMREVAQGRQQSGAARPPKLAKLLRPGDDPTRLATASLRS